MNREWLADEDNQHALYAICWEMIARYAPEEEPILEEVFPQYIKLAEQSETAPGTTPESAFAFSGEGDLLVLVVLPAITTLLGSLLASHSAARFSEIKEARQKKLEEETKELAKQHLPPALINEATPKWLLETLLNPPQQTRTP